MTPADILNFPGLSERERRVVDLRIREGLRANIVARRLGLTIAQVHSTMCTAKDRVRGKRPPAKTRAKAQTHPLVMDAGWFDRQVVYVRKLEHSDDPTHQQRYLNGISIVWGQAWADKVEAAARS